MFDLYNVAEDEECDICASETGSRALGGAHELGERRIVPAFRRDHHHSDLIQVGTLMLCVASGCLVERALDTHRATSLPGAVSSTSLVTKIWYPRHFPLTLSVS